MIDNLFAEYNEYKDLHWVNKLNRMYNIPILNKPLAKEKKIICKLRNCNLKNCYLKNCYLKKYKDQLCKLHYNKKYNLLCHVQNCNNIKRKDNMCYKHTKPLCYVLYCKCYALDNDRVCKKHKYNKIEFLI